MKIRKILLTVVTAAFILSCGLVDPKINDTILDGDVISDPAYNDSTYFLISDSIPAPTDSQKQIPVIVAAHGFTATTYEWQEFRDYADSLNELHQDPDSTLLVSQVLLGGHGRSYEEFKNSSWKEWQKPVLDEYKKLVDLGFEKISLAGSSTGGTLILELLASGAFRNIPAPKHVFLIDAIVIPGDKLLTLIDIVGPIVGNNISEGTEEENKHWYINRPAETLAELMEVMNVVRKQLESGIALPGGTEMTVYKSTKDGTAHPVSALLIFKGVRDSEGNYVEINIVDSKRHVFIRGAGRSTWTEKDSTLQYETFQEMRSIVLGS